MTAGTKSTEDTDSARGSIVEPAASQIDHDTVLQMITPYLRSDAHGIMLYGSRARGTARTDSDIDVLQIVPFKPRPVTVGRISITSYQASHLREMALRGSLFVLHLKQEGIILKDERGTLKSILEQYKAAKDYSALRRELAAAVPALDPTDEEFAKYGNSLGRLGVYLARTLSYISSVEKSSNTFDPDRIHLELNDPDLRMAMTLRRKSAGFSREDVRFLHSYLSRRLHIEDCLANLSLEALGVEISGSYPHAASLIASTLSADEQIDYAAIALQPL